MSLRTNGAFSNRLLGYRAQSSLYGRPIAILYGQQRLAANVVWTGGWTAQPAAGTKGNKGKSGATQYQYITNVLFALCAGPAQGVFSIWQDKDKFNLAYATETCSGVTTYQAVHGGVGNPEWWVLNISVARLDTVNSFSVTDYGSPASVTVPTTQVWTPMELVPASPSAGQYTLAGVAGNGSSSPPGYAIYGFSSADAGSGKTIRIQYAYQINDFSIQGSPMAHLNLSLFTGLQGQVPWYYLTNAFASQALGYSELAYIACPALDLGTAGIIPSLNFEVLGRFGPPDVIAGSGPQQFDCNPADIIRDLLTNPLDGVLGWNTSTTTATSAPISVQVSGYCTITTTLGVYPGYGTAIKFTAGTTAGMSPGQSILINQQVAQVVTIVNSTNLVATSVYAVGVVNENYPWSASIFTTLSQVTGSSAWLPANAAPNGIGNGGQVYAYCAANGIFVSLLIDTQTNSRDIINRLLEISNSDAFWSEGQLKFGCYGDTTTVGTAGAVPGVGPITYSPQTQPIYDIDDSDFLSESDEAPVNYPIPDILDVKNEVTVEWTNRSADYAQNTLAPAQDAAMVAKYGRQQDNSRSFHEITTQPVALAVQSTILKRLCYIDGAGETKLKLPPHFALLDPMDLLEVTDLYLGFNLKPMRIKDIEEDEKGRLTLTFEAFPWSVSGPTLYPNQQNSPTQAGYFASPGHVNDPLFIPMPEEIVQGNAYIVGIGLSGGPDWGGAAVYMSPDASGPFAFVGMATGAATMGYLTASLPVSPDPDISDTLELNLTECFGSIETPYVSSPAPSTFLADSFQSLIIVDSELMSFETVTQTGLYQFNLTYLRRGAYDTTISAHAIGAQFCQVLGSTLFQFNYGASNVGKTLYFKFCSVNQAGSNQEDLSNVDVFTWVVPVPRPPWPMNAGYALPMGSDAMYTAETIGVAQVYPASANGLPTPAIQVYGNPPLSVPSALVGPPAIVSVTQTTTGGSIAGGFTYLIAVNCFDAASNPNQSFLSGPVAVAVPAGTNTNQLTVTVSWPTGSYGGDAYVGKTNDSGGYHYEAAFGVGSPTTGNVAYTLNTITGVDQGPIDSQFDHMEYHIIRELVSGPFNQLCAGGGYFASSATIGGGGSGYQVGNVLILSGGTSTKLASFTIAIVSGGAVTGVTLLNQGAYSVKPSNAVATTGGSGTGCTLNITWTALGIAFGGNTTGYDYSGRALSKMANVMVASPTLVPLQDFVITSNDNFGNMFVTPSPIAAGVMPGDIFSLRTGSGISGLTVGTPLTAGNSGGFGYFIDPLMTNFYNPAGLIKHGNSSNLAVVISGTEAGQPPVTVIDNNGPSDSPANKVFTTPWAIVPDATSCIVLFEAQPELTIFGNSLPLSNYSTWLGILATISVANYAGQMLRIEAYTVDSGGFMGPQQTVPFREIYVEGAQGTVSF